MKKIIIPTILLLGILFLIKQFNPKLKLDGYYGLLCEWTSQGSENTRYSENYTDKKFLSLNEGMTEKQVYKIIGKPVYVWNYSEVNSEYCFMYSDSPTSEDYRMRKVFIKDNVVRNIVSLYYND
ncbi:outer membrane protein assembly factor BamE [bacterium SCSIO 12643]|nr:outer membrane protein assembly factor BamE [bacterium SCSIO 12643]